MFEKKYKADNERIEPTRESLLSLSYKMKREQAKKKDKKKAVRWIRSAAAVAAASRAAEAAASAEAAAERSSERLLWGGSFWAVAREDSSHFCASKRAMLSAADLRARGNGQKMPNMSTVA